MSIDDKCKGLGHFSISLLHGRESSFCKACKGFLLLRGEVEAVVDDVDAPSQELAPLHKGEEQLGSHCDLCGMCHSVESAG